MPPGFTDGSEEQDDAAIPGALHGHSFPEFCKSQNPVAKASQADRVVVCPFATVVATLAQQPDPSSPTA